MPTKNKDSRTWQPDDRKWVFGGEPPTTMAGDTLVTVLLEIELRQGVMFGEKRDFIDAWEWGADGSSNSIVAWTAESI